MSWIHRALTFMCLNFPAPFVLGYVQAAEESAHSATRSSWPQSWAIDLFTTDSAVHLTHAIKSASAELVEERVQQRR